MKMIKQFMWILSNKGKLRYLKENIKGKFKVFKCIHI